MSVSLPAKREALAGDPPASRYGMTRAELFVRGSVAALAAAVPALRAARADARSIWHPDPLRRSRFAPHLGEVFHIRRPSGGLVGVRLAAIEDVVGAAANSERSFSLTFQGRRRMAIEQGTWTISRAGVGAVELFIVPILTVGDGQDYQAIVNRSTPRRR